MATLQNIRNRGGLLVSIVIGLALVAFIVGDALSSGASIFNRSRNQVGEIAGEAISITDFQNKVDTVSYTHLPGIMSADPKLYTDTEVLPKLSYREAIELSNFGAKVIHPKTIKPLQNKKIPLFVKSFLHKEEHGSVIRELEEKLKLPPIYINKDNQLLLTLTPRDFSFIAEEKLSRIFGALAKYRLKLTLMQNSAISFSFCIDNNEAIFNSFIHELKDEYEVLYNKNVRLITIRHYTEEIIHKLIGDTPTLVEQRSRLRCV